MVQLLKYDMVQLENFGGYHLFRVPKSGLLLDYDQLDPSYFKALIFFCVLEL